MEIATRNMQFVAENLPPYIACAVLKTITNGWCTTARFHKEHVKPCMFCGQGGSDSLNRMYGCTVVHEMLVENWREMTFWVVQLPPFRVPSMLYPFGTKGMIIRVATIVEAWYYTFTWLRQQGCM